MTVVNALRRARVRSGSTLAAVAGRAGITSSNLSTIEHARRLPRSDTVDRLAEALRITFVPIDTGGRKTVAEAADVINEALADGDEHRAYRAALQLANDLHSAPPYLRALLAAEPSTLKADGWDAFIAAITEWRLQQVGLPSPDWTLATLNRSAPSWSPPGALLPARDSHIPAAFRDRGVLSRKKNSSAHDSPTATSLQPHGPR